MTLDTEIRASLARRILTSLESAVPGSTARLRGSLAEGRADQYSDTDVCWEVPDEFFQASVERLPKILSEVHPVESLRSDIFAQSIRRDREDDVHNEAAKGDDWSLTHSALMNVIAAVKSLLRNEEEEAKQLLIRAFERVRLPVPELTPQELVLKLTESVAAMDPTKAGLARKIEELHRGVFD